MKLGRKRPVAPCPHMKLRNYLDRAALPSAPPGPYGYGAKASASLSNIYKNADLGCCVIAAGLHIKGVTTGNAGSCVTFTDDQVIQQYSAIGGYDPNAPLVLDPSSGQMVNPTDQGCDEQTAMNYWMTNGFPDGSKLAGWLAVDATNPAEVQLAVWLFENLMYAVELPKKWITPFPDANGFVWDVAGPPVPANGHAFVAFDVDAQGEPEIDTWAMEGTITKAAVAHYATPSAGGGLYVLLDPAMIAKATAKAPNGLDWASLIADFDAMGGSVPVPPEPTPTPPVPPSPVPVVPPAPPTTYTLACAKGLPAGQHEAVIAPHGTYPLVVTEAVPPGHYGLVTQ